MKLTFVCSSHKHPYDVLGVCIHSKAMLNVCLQSSYSGENLREDFTSMEEESHSVY